MEQEDSMKQAAIQFRCKKLATYSVEKLNESKYASTQIKKSDKDEDSRDRIESPTPEKPECRSRAKVVGSSILKGKQLFEDFNVEGVIVQPEKINPETSNIVDSSEISPLEDVLVELPEEYETLSALFEQMDSSIRLLSLRKRLPAFRNISIQVEILSKRKFLCSHLAQMKYAFPNAIRIEKVLVHDERSLCMVPDLKVTLVEDAVGCHFMPDQSASVALCKAFRARLIEFFKTHPEGISIPQAVLPEPFNQGNQVISKTLPKGSSIELPREISTDVNLLSNASHFPSSFQQQFTHKIIPEREGTKPSAFSGPIFSNSTVDKGMEVRKSPQIKVIQGSLCPVKSPLGVVYTTSHVTPEKTEITPSKYSSTVDSFMTETPSLRTPKRPVPTTNKKSVSEDEKSVTEPKSANSVRRSLMYSPSKDDGGLSDPVACKSAEPEVPLSDCRKATISTRSIFGNEIAGSLTKQAQVASGDSAGVSSHAGEEKQRDSQASLLGMFDTICLILRSVDCSLITKQELMHKIVLNNLDVEGTGEVEEQLRLLEELVPDWISKKASSDGDCFYCIKKAYDRESVRARLVEAA